MSLCSSILFATANTAAGQVGLQVEAGLDGLAREGRWAPVRVTATNSGEPIDGRLELFLPGAQTALPLELPPRANKRLATVLVPRPGYSPQYRPSPEQVVAALRQGRAEVARVQTMLQLVPDDDRVLAVCAGEGAGLRFLHSLPLAQAGWSLPLERQSLPGGLAGYQVRVAHLLPAQMPSVWAGLAPADLLVLRDVAWAQLEPEQRRAVRQWVETGNRLILCGDDPSAFGDAEGRRLMPVAPTGLRPRAALTAFPLPDRAPIRARSGQVATVAARPRPGATVQLREAGLSIVVTRPTGFGVVLWVGFDPFRVPPATREGSRALWSFLINRATGVEAPQPGFPRLADVSAIMEPIRKLPHFPAPSRWTLASFGLAYAVLFGPVNIWLLRRLRRTVRAWLLMPLLSLALTGAVLALGATWGQGQLIFHTTSVLETMAGSGTAHEQNLAGLFSPTSRAFQLEIEDPAPLVDRLTEDGALDVSPPEGGGRYAARAGGSAHAVPPDLQDGDLHRWERVGVTLYTFQLFQTERAVDLGGEVHLELDDGLSGRVVNRTPHPLRDAYLRFRGWRYELGELPAGAARRVLAGAWQKRFQGEDASATQRAPGGYPGAAPAGGSYPAGGPTGTVSGDLQAIAPSLIRGSPNRSEVVLAAHVSDLMLLLRFPGVPRSTAPGLSNDVLLLVRQSVPPTATPRGALRR